MSVLWILTIGSSDIQFESRAETKRKKQSSEQSKRKELSQIWGYWYKAFQAYLRENYKENFSFEPICIGREIDDSYGIKARVLGMMYQYYQDQDDAVQDEIWDYLTFPLLDNFVADQSFQSFRDASLMAEVHQELEKAIAHL